VAEALQITERRDIQLATIMARKGVGPDVLGERLGLMLPRGAKMTRGGDMTLIGTGPGVWLAVSQSVQTDWVDSLRGTLAGIASVSEQSAGYLVLRMVGPCACDLLQKGAFIDLHPDVFQVGDAAVTAIAHIGVLLWKIDDAPTFDVAVFRSLSGSFREWVAAAADKPVQFA
jgi:sarcosine oxidase subunit gamma